MSDRLRMTLIFYVLVAAFNAVLYAILVAVFQ